MLKDITLKDLVLTLNLPVLATTSTQERYDAQAAKLDRLSQNSSLGRGSAFELRKTELHKAAFATTRGQALVPGQNLARVCKLMEDSAWIRPLLDLWTTNATFIQALPPCDEILAHVRRVLQKTRKGRLSRLAMRESCMLFFQKYDLLPGYGLFGEFVQEQLAAYADHELMNGLDVLKEVRKDMLSDQAHRALGSALPERWQCNLAGAAEKLGIPAQSRLFAKAVQVHYLARLQALPPNAEDRLLTEVRNPDLYEQFVNKSLRFGHMVLHVLIAKLQQAGAKPCALWMDTLLAIGGDPRLPRESRSFRMWWKPLEEQKPDFLQSVYEWLSEQDLELFLQICREFSSQSSQEAMRRLYPEREYFLRGLFKKKLIRQTRLFLGSKVQAYVERSFAGKKKPWFTRSTGNPDLAIFYLNLGNAHMIEGSHNFTATLMDRIPPASVLASWQSQVAQRDLGPGLEEQYREAFPGSRFLFRFRHHANGRWKLDTVQALRDFGVNVVESDVMPLSDYYKIRRY